jgi:hypothetical protein
MVVYRIMWLGGLCVGVHGTDIKLLSPQQAKSSIQYRNTKLKLLKTNAVTWFNKMCRNKQLTLKYINKPRHTDTQAT